jgi:hypothetical protein
MRLIFGLSALALMASTPALAQGPYGGAPPGSYARQCTDIRMSGSMLSAYCRGSRGSGQSSINVLSCSTEISVDPSGGLTCIGPGGGAPPSVRDAPPGYATGERPSYDPERGARDDRGYRGDRGDRGGYGDRRDPRRAAVTVFAGRDWRGRPVTIAGAASNLAAYGLNDRVGSIRLERGSGPWMVCTDANYRGRCTTIDRSVANTRALGMGESISSLRPAW